MELVAHVVVALAAVALGLTAGALVTEGAVLVPFWRSLPPDAFLAWYRQHARLLLAVFGSLEVAGLGLALAAAIVNALHRVAAAPWLAVSAALAAAVLLLFPLYFRKVNAGFAAATIAPDRVPEQLRRWARWHWARTALAVGAFVSAVVALHARHVGS